MFLQRSQVKPEYDGEYGNRAFQTAGDLCKTPICGAFLRCVLLTRLPIYLICLRSLRCYALNCIRI